MNKIRVVLLLAGLVLQSAVFAQAERTKSIKVGKNGDLDVSLNTGSITIVAWDRNEISVRPKGHFEDDEFPIKIYQSDNSVKITEKSSAYYSSDMDLVVNVPSAFNINIRTSSGDLTLKGNFSGESKGVTYGGDIRIGNSSGNIDFNTSGGDIVVGEIKGNVIVNTYGGDISIGSISGEAEISTSGGDITLKDVGKQLKVVTYGGDIKIGNVGNDADVSTSGGDIIVSNLSGDAKLNTYGGDIVVNGASGYVHAKTSGGDLHFWNVTGSVDASTYSGDIDLQINPKNNKKTKIYSAQGDINVFIPENARATIEARIKGMDDDETHEIISDYKHKIFEKKKYGEIKAVYVLNGGGETIYLETNNSDIRIKKRVTKSED